MLTFIKRLLLQKKNIGAVQKYKYPIYPSVMKLERITRDWGRKLKPNFALFDPRKN